LLLQRRDSRFEQFCGCRELLFQFLELLLRILSAGRRRRAKDENEEAQYSSEAWTSSSRHSWNHICVGTHVAALRTVLLNHDPLELTKSTVNQTYGSRSFDDGGSYPLYTSSAHIAYSEHAWEAGFKHLGRAG